MLLPAVQEKTWTWCPRSWRVHDNLLVRLILWPEKPLLKWIGCARTNRRAQLDKTVVDVSGQWLTVNDQRSLICERWMHHSECPPRDTCNLWQKSKSVIECFWICLSKLSHELFFCRFVISTHKMVKENGVTMWWLLLTFIATFRHFRMFYSLMEAFEMN